VDEQLLAGVIATLLFARSLQEHPLSEGERRCTGTLLTSLMEDLESLSLPIDMYCEGPWWVGCDTLSSPQRNGDLAIPTLTCGHFRLRVDDFQQAAQLAGYLSWRHVPEPILALSWRDTVVAILKGA
jgi:hypothetical protein